VTWEEVERGATIEDFRMDNVPQRVSKLGDLWKPLLLERGRLRLELSMTLPINPPYWPMDALSTAEIPTGPE
jgi:DNA primase